MLEKEPFISLQNFAVDTLQSIYSEIKVGASLLNKSMGYLVNSLVCNVNLSIFLKYLLAIWIFVKITKTVEKWHFMGKV